MSYIEGNKEAWEEAFEHRQPNWGDENYIRLLNEKLPFFDENAAEELQKIHFAGKDIAQFCCNNGRELLSLVKNGANSGVGFDIAENILEQARITAEKAGITNCNFVAANILDIPEEYHNSFDLVMFTIGAITWFENLEPLFQKAADCLRPGGIMYIQDFHPIMNMLALPGAPEYDEQKIYGVAYSYFRKEPWVENEGMGYMSETYDSKTFISFSHTMAGIINAACKAGLRITGLKEYDYDVGLSEIYDGKGYPLSFILTAEK
ncbi:class I SAM-dependent methyltransferase [[Clostridium] symbiosum]|uniref:class I SAM-dependent methyltransferase n=1 Tax=Clostridium symbiosum TaxID=1512 RepID=UPI001D08DAB1|nr:class I SAM-dependent methyltransferase [[Clostridium] symbiosum]MCB6610753.1 class I SAM-dependent methyltransferase [[Clostridium] symbiosum]MCB6931768.1 class I SAM-dependent methyltransferase [[Clostridium] symbiosum]